MWKQLCLSALALGAAAAAAGRPDLNGTWQLDLSRSELGDDKLKSETLEIQQMEDSVQIADAMIAADGKERKSDIQCNTLGKECQFQRRAGLVLVQRAHADHHGEAAGERGSGQETPEGIRRWPDAQHGGNSHGAVGREDQEFHVHETAGHGRCEALNGRRLLDDLGIRCPVAPDRDLTPLWAGT